MADLTLTATITRDELSLADLALNADPYRVAGRSLEVGRVARRREVAYSVFYHGGVEVASVKDLATLTLAIDVTGTTMANVVTNLNALIAAFSQSSYTLSFVVDGQTFTYDCNAADYETSMTTPRMTAKKVVALFECPRQPGTGIGTPP